MLADKPPDKMSRENGRAHLGRPLSVSILMCTIRWARAFVVIDSIAREETIRTLTLHSFFLHCPSYYGGSDRFARYAVQLTTHSPLSERWISDTN